MNTDSPSLLAIEIGGSKLQLFAGRADGTILERRRFTVDRPAGGPGIRSQIASALPALIDQWRPAAIGVGYGGPVDWKSGKIVKSYHIQGWNDFPLGSWLGEQSGLPVFIENDASTAAFGEAHHGAGVGANPVFYITLGSGVGGGLVVGGNIYHGAPPGEVEIGHVRLDPSGTIVEDRCSGWGVDRRIRQAVAQHPDSRLATLLAGAPEGGEARHLVTALNEGDELAECILKESMRHLAFALSHVIHLLHPEVIVVGGGLSLIGEPLRTALEAQIPGFLMDAFLPGPAVRLAELGEDSVPVGALALAAARLRDQTT